MGKGKLRFKGDAKKKKKKSKHAKLTVIEHDSVSKSAEAGPSSSTPHSLTHTLSAERPAKKLNAEVPTLQEGEGMIMSSGTVLMGHETNFSEIINAGDAILVKVPSKSKDGSNTMVEEMRVITMRLSDASASISSAFSSDLKSPTSFQYIAKPRNQRKEKVEKEKNARLTKQEIERSAFGTYQGTEFVYRERTENGGYRIRRESVRDDSTRSDLLSMRAQKKVNSRCRHCLLIIQHSLFLIKNLIVKKILLCIERQVLLTDLHCR